MSSHPYVSQQNTPLDDDITLMSTTDLQSYIRKRRLRICGTP